MSLLDPLQTDEAVRNTAARLGWSSDRPLLATVAICAAALAVVLDASYFLLDLPFPLRLGGVPVSPSIVPVLVILAVSGGRLLGRPRSTDSAKTFWVLTLLVLAVVTLAIEGMGPSRSAGFVLAALTEELVYRVAGPAVLAFGLARAGVPYRHALTIGYVVAGIAFVILPGHIAQWDETAYVAPFIAFTVLATLAVHRSGAVLEIGLLHSAINIVNLGRSTGAIDSNGALLVAALLGLLVIGYIPAGGRRPDVVIDLTGDQPTVTTDTGLWTVSRPLDAPGAPQHADHTVRSAAETHRAPTTGPPPAETGA